MSALLAVRHLTVRFGGLTALNELSLEVRPGEIVGVIGPNGSGKTTLFNCVTGLYRATAGSIAFGNAASGDDAPYPHDIVERGISRTFQTLRVFPNLSVLENVLVGLHCRRRAGVLGAILRPAWVVTEEADAAKRAQELLAIFGDRLLPRTTWPARSLSYANRRRLEIARALATNPRLLLLDEPTAGMNPTEKQELTGVIRTIRDSGRDGAPHRARHAGGDADGRPGDRDELRGADRRGAPRRGRAGPGRGRGLPRQDGERCLGSGTSTPATGASACCGA